jgi:lipoprotein-releasing system permease protein
LRRGAKVAQVSIIGLKPGRESAIVNLRGYLVAGTADLGAGSILMGVTGADKLGLSVGQSVHLQSSEGIDTILTLTGTFDMGSSGFDLGLTYVSIATARILFRKPQGLSRIEIKLDDIFTANAITARVEALTGLDATSWSESYPQLMDGLAAQAQVGLVLKTFALITIVIGVASAMMLSSYRRRPEIGIMRAMGAGRMFVVYIFVLQGALIGILGALLGAGFGYGVLAFFPAVEDAKPGSLPIDVRQGAYGMAVLLTTIGAIVASILPARGAARLDPVQAIGQ